MGMQSYVGTVCVVGMIQAFLRSKQVTVQFPEVRSATRFIFEPPSSISFHRRCMSPFYSEVCWAIR